MTAQPTVQPSPRVKQPRRVGRGTILVVGVVLIPIALSVAFNSYGPLTVDGAIRMAFATVAGETIAILSALTGLVLTVKRRYAWPAIVAFTIILAVVTAWAFGSIASAGDLLLDRLSRIAEVNELNF